MNVLTRIVRGWHSIQQCNIERVHRNIVAGLFGCHTLLGGYLAPQEKGLAAFELPLYETLILHHPSRNRAKTHTSYKSPEDRRVVRKQKSM